MGGAVMSITSYGDSFGSFFAKHGLDFVRSESSGAPLHVSADFFRSKAFSLAFSFDPNNGRLVHIGRADADCSIKTLIDDRTGWALASELWGDFYLEYCALADSMDYPERPSDRQWGGAVEHSLTELVRRIEIGEASLP